MEGTAEERIAHLEEALGQANEAILQRNRLLQLASEELEKASEAEVVPRQDTVVLEQWGRLRQAIGAGLAELNGADVVTVDTSLSVGALEGAHVDFSRVMGISREHLRSVSSLIEAGIKDVERYEELEKRLAQQVNGQSKQTRATSESAARLRRQAAAAEVAEAAAQRQATQARLELASEKAELDSVRQKLSVGGWSDQTAWVELEAARRENARLQHAESAAAAAENRSADAATAVAQRAEELIRSMQRRTSGHTAGNGTAALEAAQRQIADLQLEVLRLQEAGSGQALREAKAEAARERHLRVDLENRLADMRSSRGGRDADASGAQWLSDEVESLRGKLEDTSAALHASREVVDNLEHALTVERQVSATLRESVAALEASSFATAAVTAPRVEAWSVSSQDSFRARSPMSKEGWADALRRRQQAHAESGRTQGVLSASPWQGTAWGTPAPAPQRPWQRPERTANEAARAQLRQMARRLSEESEMATANGHSPLPSQVRSEASSLALSGLSFFPETVLHTRETKEAAHTATTDNAEEVPSQRRVSTFVQIAEVYVEEGDYRSAMTYTKRAADLLEQLGSPSGALPDKVRRLQLKCQQQLPGPAGSPPVEDDDGFMTPLDSVRPREA
mmetsp:Transcript_97376/g.223164  ORF Transcript_97376/g.223164 Transcript_97376/m.223164 type:complete len:627 (+) Transcript_97376:74-1954(+)